MYQHCPNPFAIKQRRKSIDLSPKPCFWASKQLFAIHFLLATCNVCPLTIPEFFAQTRVSDYWQLIHYQCDLYDAEYVGYTSRHLHQCIDEHRFSTIGKHLKNDHSLYNIDDLANNFFILKKCNGKLDCLIYEMLFIRKKKPSLNTQSDSIRAKLFV